MAPGRHSSPEPLAQAAVPAPTAQASTAATRDSISISKQIALQSLGVCAFFCTVEEWSARLGTAVLSSQTALPALALEARQQRLPALGVGKRCLCRTSHHCFVPSSPSSWTRSCLEEAPAPLAVPAVPQLCASLHKTVLFCGDERADHELLQMQAITHQMPRFQFGCLVHWHPWDTTQVRR